MAQEEHLHASSHPHVRLGRVLQLSRQARNPSAAVLAAGVSLVTASPMKGPRCCSFPQQLAAGDLSLQRQTDRPLPVLLQEEDFKHGWDLLWWPLVR